MFFVLLWLQRTSSTYDDAICDYLFLHYCAIRGRGDGTLILLLIDMDIKDKYN